MISTGTILMGYVTEFSTYPWRSVVNGILFLNILIYHWKNYMTFVYL